MPTFPRWTFLIALPLAACFAKGPDYPPVGQPERSACPASDNDDAVICVDLTGGDRAVTAGPDRNVVQINRALVLWVRHPGGLNVTATWGGSEGIAEAARDVPKAPVERKAGRAPADDGEPQRASPPAVVQSTFRFSPRQPGAAPLTLTWTTPHNDAGSGTLTIDLQVEALSWGAVRLGVGTVFGDAVSKTYELRSFAGSSQPEIALTDNARMGFEGVLGVAPYLFDVLTCPGHGRSFTGGCNWHIAPYVGFGILGQSATGVQSFDALFVGGEIAFSSSYSLAFTWVARRKTELASGYREGSPADVGTPFTRNATGYGFGLILNITPDFFSFATPASDPPPANHASPDGGAS